jgi:hypothetical protein
MASKVFKIQQGVNAISKKGAVENTQGFVVSSDALQRIVPGGAFNNVVINRFDSRVATSYLGTPVYSNIEFPAALFTDLDGNVTEFQGITINTVIMTIDQPKNIVRTAIQGRNGTIKEYIGNGDFKINVTGALITEPRVFSAHQNEYPREQVKALFELLSAQEAITVRGEFLQQLGINSVVITSYSFPQTKGNRDKQLFTIKMESDTELLLEESETQV